MATVELHQRWSALSEDTRREVLTRSGTTLDAASLDRFLRTGAGGLGGTVWSRLLAELALHEGHEEALVGEQVAQVRVEAVLGGGGMGAVYRGYDTWLERPVALKTVRRTLRDDPEASARFRREARLLSRLDHPKICRVYNLVRHADHDYLVLELIDGEPLDTVDLGSLDLDTRTRLARDIADALVVAHGEQVVHRDLKPSNVMVTRDGSVKVLDFGLSVSADDPTSTGVEGTFAYMSPEQARGEPPTPASDIYSFGLVIQELFTGRRARADGASHAERLALARRGERRSAEGLDAERRRLVDDTLALDPSARPDARQLRERLGRLVDAPRRRRRRRWTAAVGLLAAVLVAAIAALAHRAGREAPIRIASGARLVLPPITNATGDASLDWVEDGLSALVARTLATAPSLDVVPPAEVGSSTPETPPGVLLDRYGGDAVVVVRLDAVGDRYRLAWTLHSRDRAPVERRLDGLDPAILAREASLRMLRALAPEASSAARRAGATAFSGDPFVDRAYAIGLQRLAREGPESARPYFEICRQEDPKFLPAAVSLAVVRAKQNQRAEARIALVELLDEPALTDRQRLALLSELLTLAGGEGDRPAAERWLDAMEATIESLDHPDLVLHGLATIAETRARLGELDAADAALDRAGRHMADGQWPRHRVRLLLLRAFLDQQRGDGERAAARLAEAEPIARATDDRRQLAIVLANGVEPLFERGDYAGALDRAGEAQALFEAQRMDEEATVMMNSRAILLGYVGRHEESEALLRDMVERAEGHDEVRGRALIGLVDLLLRQGRADEATRPLDQLEALGNWSATGPIARELRIRWLYEQGRFADALDAARRFAESLPEAGRAELAELVSACRQAARTGRRVPLSSDLPRDGGA